MRGEAPPLTRLGRAWFARPTVTVARELVGSRLAVVGADGMAVVCRLVEVEAYLGERDPASHAFRGPTPRAGIMFGEPGHLYVYLSYGVHHCANLVTESEGTAGAVLLRGAAVEAGEEAMRSRRPTVATTAALLRGPGNLCRGLGISLLDNGADVCAGQRIWLEPRDSVPPLTAAPRVGISLATRRRLRFCWTGHPAVSAPQPWGRAWPRSPAKEEGTG